MIWLLFIEEAHPRRTTRYVGKASNDVVTFVDERGCVLLQHHVDTLKLMAGSVFNAGPDEGGWRVVEALAVAS